MWNLISAPAIWEIWSTSSNFTATYQNSAFEAANSKQRKKESWYIVIWSPFTPVQCPHATRSGQATTQTTCPQWLMVLQTPLLSVSMIEYHQRLTIVIWSDFMPNIDLPVAFWELKGTPGEKFCSSIIGCSFEPSWSRWYRYGKWCNWNHFISI